MKKRSGFGFVHSAAALAIAFGAIGQAQAAGYCNTNSASNAAALHAGSVDPSNGLVVSDVTFNLANSENCYGLMAGNDTGNGQDKASVVNNGAGLFGQTDWTYLAQSQAGGGGGETTGSFNVGTSTYNFTLSADQGTTGDWTLTVGPSGNTFPIWLDFVVTLKASDGFGAYLFDDTQVNASNDGTFKVKMTNNRGVYQSLSHLSLFVRQGTGGGGGGDNEVPLPGSLSLAALALGGLGLSRRRRKPA